MKCEEYGDFLGNAAPTTATQINHCHPNSDQCIKNCKNSNYPFCKNPKMLVHVVPCKSSAKESLFEW